MSSVVVHLEVHVLDWRSGLWCDRCLLPSAVEVTIALVSADSLKVMRTINRTVCPECE